MLDFASDPNITGGSIDDWYVDDKYSDSSKSIYRPQIDSAIKIDLEPVNVSEELSIKKSAGLEETKCNQRLMLLAESYAESEQSDYWVESTTGAEKRRYRGCLLLVAFARYQCLTPSHILRFQ